MPSRSMFHRNVLKMLSEKEFEFEIREIQHALQIRFQDGAILNISNTGAITWQGQDTHTQKKVHRILKRLEPRPRPLFANV